ncbi:MAG: hypothetical protein ABW174_06335 [Flavitalea sp.]
MIKRLSIGIHANGFVAFIIYDFYFSESYYGIMHNITKTKPYETNIRTQPVDDLRLLCTDDDRMYRVLTYRSFRSGRR